MTSRRLTGRLYAIASGEYDSYTVHGVIRGKVAAEGLLARLNTTPQFFAHTYRLEPISEITPDVQQVTTYRINVEVSDDGTTTIQNLAPATEWPFDMLHPQQNVPAGWRWVRAPCHNGKGGRLEVYGTDLDAVDTLREMMTGYLLAGGQVRRCRERTGTSVPTSPMLGMSIQKSRPGVP